MELRQLRYFLAVAQDGSFTAAAETLHVAQPTLSVSLSRLERELGYRLFERSGRSKVLTPAGKVFRTEIEALFASLEFAIERAQKVNDGSRGRLRIGFLGALSHTLLPKVVTEYRNLYPQIELDLLELTPDLVRDGIKGKRLDLGLIYIPTGDADFVEQELLKEPLIVAVPAGHPLADRQRIEAFELRNSRFVLPAEYGMPGLRVRITAICAKEGFMPDVSQSDVRSAHTALGLVAAGVGVTILPKSQAEIRTAGVEYLSLGRSPETVHLGAIRLRDVQNFPVTAFIEIAKNCLSGLSY